MNTAVGIAIEINDKGRSLCLTIMGVPHYTYLVKPELPPNVVLLVTDKLTPEETITNLFNGVYDKQIIGIDYDDHLYKCSVGYIRTSLMDGIKQREQNPNQLHICDLSLPKITDP